MPKPPSKALGSDVAVGEEIEFEEAIAVTVAAVVDVVSVLAGSSRRCKAG